MVPAAKINLAAKDRNANKLTKKEIFALLIACYAAVADESKHNKSTLVDILSENIAANPERVATAPASADAIAPVPVPAAAVDPVADTAGAADAAAVVPDVPSNPSSQV